MERTPLTTHPQPKNHKPTGQQQDLVQRLHWECLKEKEKTENFLQRVFIKEGESAIASLWSCLPILLDGKELWQDQ